MKALLLVLAVISAVVIAQPPPPTPGQMVTATQYANHDCTGGIVANHSMPTNMCLNATGVHNVSSVNLHCRPAEGLCASISPNSQPSCSHKNETFNMLCGMCFEAPDIGHHRFNCFLRNKTVVAQLHCDAGCKNCNESHTMTVGQCTTYSNGTKTVMLNSLGKCPASVHEEAWDQKNCMGNKRDFHMWEGECEFGWMFSCSGSQKNQYKRLGDKMKSFFKRMGKAQP